MAQDNLAVIPQDLLVRGILRVVRDVSFPDESIDWRWMKGAPPTSKQSPQYKFTFADESATSASDGDHVIDATYGATGVILSFRAGAVVPCLAGAIVTIDLLKNGTTILTAPIVLTDGDSPYIFQNATIADAAVTTEDVFEVSIVTTIGGGTLATGVFAQVIASEDATV